MDRAASGTATAGRDELRSLGDRIATVERLVRDITQGTRGLGSRLVLADVEITVEATSPTARTVRFTNLLTGATDTIVL